MKSLKRIKLLYHYKKMRKLININLYMVNALMMIELLNDKINIWNIVNNYKRSNININDLIIDITKHYNAIIKLL